MARPGALQQAYGELDRLSRHRYGIPGDVLLAKLEKGESGGSGKAVSGAGARAWYQFMPGTRKAVLQYTGGKIDPWRSEAEARDAAVLHLTGKLGNAPGLEGYNPGGGSSYVHYILGQKVGASGPAPRFAPAPAPSTLPAPNPVAGLAQTLQQPQGTVSAPPPPAFAAKAPVPQGFQPPPGVPGNAGPDQGLAQILRGPADIPLSGPAPSLSGAYSRGNVDSDPSAGGLPKGTLSYRVRDVFSRAAKIDAEHLPYKWGGGHGPTPARPGVPLDCSGAVSRLFGISPRVSGDFTQFGQAGRGKAVTIYANKDHVLVEIAGRFWGTSASNPQGGAGWIPRAAVSPSYLRNFTARHPAGM